MAEVQPIPEGYPRVSPYLIVDGANDAIDFYTEVFGAAEHARMEAPGGTVAHAEITIGDSMIMLGDPSPDLDARDPKQVGGTPVSLMIYVEDADAVFSRAVAKGAKALTEVSEQFYGDRLGSFEDPWGHRWYVGTHVEDVTPEEMKRRAAEAMS
ncbi:VOC family protein [Glycomyces halotolerans]